MQVTLAKVFLAAETHKRTSFFYCKSSALELCAFRLFDKIPERTKFQQFAPPVIGSTRSESTRAYHRVQEPERASDRKHNKYSYSNEILGHLRNLHCSGKIPTKFMLCSAISSCTKALNWHLGIQIHAHTIHRGYEDNIVLSSALVDFYAKSDAMFDARTIFEHMERHDEVSWTSIISGFAHNKQGREAILLFKEMMLTLIKPNCSTYVSVISACTELETTMEQVTMLQAHLIKLGFETNSFVVSSLIDCYSKCGRVDQATLLFDAAGEKDNVLLNSMIAGYSQNSYGEEALRLFIKMRKDGFSTTDCSLTSILNACGSLAVFGQGKQVQCLAIKMGSECNVFVVSALIDMYAKCGSICEARQVFDQAREKNSVLWTSMIMGYAQTGRPLDGLELFDRLVTGGSAPDLICFTAVLTACNHAGLLERGIEYFNKMKDHGLVPELDQYACVIDLYSRKGFLGKAKQVMEEMPYAPNSIMWSSFLSSCKIYGEVELGRQAAAQLFEMEPCNAAHYVTMAGIYAEAGLWDEVADIRKKMRGKGIRKKSGWSWIEVDDTIHVFSVDDASHPQSLDLYIELKRLTLEMKEAGYMSKLFCEFDNIESEHLSWVGS